MAPPSEQTDQSEYRKVVGWKATESRKQTKGGRKRKSGGGKEEEEKEV